jgi:hypothetical protein
MSKPYGDQINFEANYIVSQAFNANSIVESIDWNSPEWNIETNKDTVKIKGVAVPKDAISLNKRAYLNEEMKKAARTFLDAPVTPNHADYRLKKNQKGKVNWMEYDDQTGAT